jgi:hypothetical protein
VRCLVFSGITYVTDAISSWQSAKGSCCLPHGGSPSAPPPSGSSCPSKWYWSSKESCCVPSVPTEPTTPTCPSYSSPWNSKEQCCKPPAPSSSAKIVVTTSKVTVPTTSYKPPSPTTSPAPPTTSSVSECSGNEFLCVTSSTTVFDSVDTVFRWNALKGKCCVPHGGQPSPPSPPSGSSCPSSWYWHSGQSCCVPNHPSPPTPTCPPNSWWGNQCCNHNPAPPKPSGHYKRSLKKRSAGLCPVGLQACPIGGFMGLTADYECIDTNLELQSCGGCSSVESQFDCTAIEGSWNVGCEQGSCKGTCLRRHAVDACKLTGSGSVLLRSRLQARAQRRFLCQALVSKRRTYPEICPPLDYPDK